MADANFGSLSPRLLARKGGARPAMRSQANLPAAMPHDSAADLEDLGWNDLGVEAGVTAPTAEVIAFSTGRPQPPVIGAQPRAAMTRDGDPTPAAAQLKKARADRAAFTLRLDADRHLQLRLACTVRQCSAQQLVTDALDAFLAEMPDLQKFAQDLSTQMGRA